MEEYVDRLKKDGYIDTFEEHGDFLDSFEFENKVHPIDDYIYSFKNAMPQIEFYDDEDLTDTLKEYYGIISNQSHAYDKTSYPVRMFSMLDNPSDLTKLDGMLDSSLRHQCSIYTQTYYWIIFMIEMLRRHPDAINAVDDNDCEIPLKRQLYYEFYVLDGILSYYSRDLQPSYIYYSTDKTSDFHKTFVTEKIISMVEEHIIKMKSTLIEKCKKNEITPIRAMWLYACPMKSSEVRSILSCTNNKYIRCSIFWVAGFQLLTTIKNLCKTSLETTAFENGLSVKKGYNARNQNLSITKKNKKNEPCIDDDRKPNSSVEEFKSFVLFCYRWLYQIESESDMENYKNHYGWDGSSEKVEEILEKEPHYKTNYYDSYIERIQFFQKLKSIKKEECDNNTIKDLYKLKNNEDKPNYVNLHVANVSFHPFYSFTYNTNNFWNTVIYDKGINGNYANMAQEYRSYYKDHSSKTHYYFTDKEYDDNNEYCYFLYDRYIYIQQRDKKNDFF